MSLPMDRISELMVAKTFRITQASVEDATCKPGQKDTLFFDGDLKGFGLRIAHSGAKWFFIQYSAHGATRRVTVGRFGTITPAEARRAARALLASVALGDDPYASRKAATVAAHAAKTESAFTVNALVEAWAEGRKADRRPSYITEAVACIARHLPEWRDRPAGTITFAEAVAALDAVKAAKGIVAANRTLSYIRAAYGWSVRRQQLATNPFKGIERPGREVARERVLTAPELAAIWRACDTLTPVRAAFVRVLMLTLQRSGEVAAMPWSELDAPPSVWILPAERAKNRRPHVVHLSDPVRAIIRGLPRIRGNPFVFAGDGGKPIDGSSHTKDQIQAALSRSSTNIRDWRFHDFRRTGVTALAGLNVAPHIADKLLNHVTGSIQGVAAVYQRHEFMAERKAALDAWAKFVIAAVEAQPLAPAA
jgi:integrase